jgi:hypothetical protein
MSKLGNYIHYYMTDEEITRIHKKEILEMYESCGKDISKLSSFAGDWFLKYFPNKKGENNE